jgi:hypothetical protein
LVALFLPSFLLVIGALSFWDDLRGGITDVTARLYSEVVWGLLEKKIAARKSRRQYIQKQSYLESSDGASGVITVSQSKSVCESDQRQ